MDMKQEEISTLHDLYADKTQLMKQVSDAASELPVSVVMPMLYKEIKNEALENIITHLNKCTYLKEVIIPLAANNEEEFIHVKKFFSKLTIPKLIIWCNGPKVTNLLTQLKNQGLDLINFSGKGRDIWIALGIASIESYGIVLHDADIQSYDESIPTKLLYPLLEPELDFKFNKGYYARVSYDKTAMYGRVFRLFLHPLLRSLVDVLNNEPDFIRFLRAFRYPISGEFALTSDLARDLDIPSGWGVEIGVMAEIYRNIASKRVCQTDLGFYEHKHQEIGDSTKGLVKMSGDIFKSLLRVLIEEDHIEVTRSFLLSLRVLYHKNAQSCIKKYHADAQFNGIAYDRHLEESMVEQFSNELMTAGNNYTLEPVYTRLPDWLRTMSAKRKIREELLEIVTEENK
ncbi:MAG: glucosyl-3-phosphoglycerate synthase [Candidatus Thermoplasmatota archaeon]|jgi:glucosyl-3-phosphoglycerate synthase|nr:glucosyl-3-phosphoglycerate synthase [Candidatus Thermoplasmatota archaeon]